MSDEPKSGARTLGWILVGTGAGIFVAGVGSLVVANALKPNADTSSKASTQRTFVTLSMVGLSVGAATSAVGGVLIWTSPSKKESVGVSPSVGVGFAGVELGGAF